MAQYTLLITAKCSTWNKKCRIYYIYLSIFWQHFFRRGIISSPETAHPLSLRDIPLTGGPHRGGHSRHKISPTMHENFAVTPPDEAVTCLRRDWHFSASGLAAYFTHSSANCLLPPLISAGHATGVLLLRTFNYCTMTNYAIRPCGYMLFSPQDIL